MTRQQSLYRLQNLINYIFNITEGDSSEHAETLRNEAAVVKVEYIEKQEPTYSLNMMYYELNEDIERYRYNTRILN